MTPEEIREKHPRTIACANNLKHGRLTATVCKWCLEVTRSQELQAWKFLSEMHNPDHREGREGGPNSNITPAERERRDRLRDGMRRNIPR